MASESSMDVDSSSSIACAGAGAGAQQAQRPSWRPRLVAYAAAATSSSTSGGSLSTTYTSGSSHLQSSSSGDGGLARAVASFSLLELEEERENMRRHIMCHVQEFTAAGDDEDAAALVLERYFSDLGISWVLRIFNDGKSPAAAFMPPQRLSDLARSWIDALTVIQLSIFTYIERLWNYGSWNHEKGAFSYVPTVTESARFLQSTLLNMLPFADAVVLSARVNGACIQQNLWDWDAMVPAEEKFRTVIGMRHALSNFSENFQTWYPWHPSIEGSPGILHHQTMTSLLSEKMDKFDEAVWDNVDEIRKSIISLAGNHNEAESMDPQILERSPDIHKVTRSTVSWMKDLSMTDYGLLHQIVSNAACLGKYVPQDKMGLPFSADPMAMLIMEMVSYLQENLELLSQSFPDQSLGLLFLLNNTHFMWQQLHHPSSFGVQLYVLALARKIDYHIQRYLQASWIPVVSGLHDPTPLCLGRYSPLTKFESLFQKTYTSQKLWKVPDPDLRRRLRKAITEAVIPTLTKYLEDNKITGPRVTQQELEDMLQDLFEG